MTFKYSIFSQNSSSQCFWSTGLSALRKDFIQFQHSLVNIITCQKNEAEIEGLVSKSHLRKTRRAGFRFYFLGQHGLSCDCCDSPPSWLVYAPVKVLCSAAFFLDIESPQATQGRVSNHQGDCRGLKGWIFIQVPGSHQIDKDNESKSKECSELGLRLSIPTSHELPLLF